MSLDLLTTDRGPSRTRADDGPVPPQGPVGSQCQSATAEPDCPYCSGPETD